MPDTFAPLTWDAVSKRFFENGVSKVALFPMNDDGTYAAGVAWNGITAVNITPEGGEPTDLWANNKKYATMMSAEQIKGTIEAYTYPDEFGACNGETALATGAYAHQQTRKRFGLCFRTEIGNDVTQKAGYKLHFLYGCLAKPSSVNHETTNDSPDAQPFSWDFDTTPVAVTGKDDTAYIEVDSRKFTDANLSKLTALETKVYGSTTAAAAMPDPAFIITTLT